MHRGQLRDRKAITPHLGTTGVVKPVDLMWLELTMQVLAVCLRGAGAQPEAGGLEDLSALELPVPA